MNVRLSTIFFGQCCTIQIEYLVILLLDLNAVKNGVNLAGPAFEFQVEKFLDLVWFPFLLEELVANLLLLLVWQDDSVVDSKCATSTCTPLNVEESSCPFKSKTKMAVQDAKEYRTSSTSEAVKSSNFDANGSMCSHDVNESPLHKHDTSSLNKYACADENAVSILF